MDVRAFIATALHELEAVLRDDRSARIAAISGLAAMLVVSTLTVLVSRLRVRRHGRPNHSAAPAINPGGWDLGDAFVSTVQSW